MTKPSIYKEADDLTSGVDEQASSTKRPSRKKRSVSPAANPGDTRVEGQANVLDKLVRKNEEIEGKLEKALADLEVASQSGNQEEVDKLNKELVRLRESGAQHGDTMSRVMPVTKSEVAFRLEEVDPSLCDVSSLNGRDQQLLDAGCVEDILPSMRATGQLVPGMGRKKKDGRYEVVEGSRRLYAVKLLDVPYQMWVGDIADADIAQISEKGNEHEKTSPWELAQLYAKQIEAGTYKNWEHLVLEKGIPDRTARRYKNMIGIDRLFVRPFHMPSGFSLRFSEWLLGKFAQCDAKKILVDTARTLAKEKAKTLKSGEEWLADDEVQKSFKRALRDASEEKEQGTGMATRGFSEFSNESRGFSMEARNMRGGKRKLEFAGMSDEVFADVVSLVTEKLKLKKQE